jgi:hypothetical protein
MRWLGALAWIGLGSIGVVVLVAAMLEEERVV